MATLFTSILETLRYRYFPRFVDKSVQLMLAGARHEIDRAWSNKILVDTTILGHSIAHETAWISTGMKTWGAVEIPTGYAARIPVHSPEDRSDEARCVRFLAPIASLARSNAIQLLSSKELSDERWTLKSGVLNGYGAFDHSLMRGVPITELPDAQYSVVLGPKLMNLPNLREQRKERLSKKEQPLYRDLVRVLGGSNSQDAWHIYTAEENGCYCFLTMDFKLLRNFSAQSQNKVIAGLKTQVLSPEEFGRRFRLPSISPRLYSYHGASSLVRADLHWPNSKRRNKEK